MVKIMALVDNFYGDHPGWDPIGAGKSMVTRREGHRVGTELSPDPNDSLMERVSAAPHTIAIAMTKYRACMETLLLPSVGRLM